MPNGGTTRRWLAPGVPHDILIAILSRQHRGLSLRSLADKIGTSRSALSDIETGKSEGRLSILHRVAGALDVGLEELLPAAGRDKRMRA
jgi:transcriptional regulator with XRE-family HTH domain